MTMTSIQQTKMKQVAKLSLILFAIIGCKSGADNDSQAKDSVSHARSEQMTTSNGSTFRSPSFLLEYDEQAGSARLYPAASVGVGVKMACDGGLFHIGMTTCTDSGGKITFKAVRPASLSAPHSAISATIYWVQIPTSTTPVSAGLSGKYVHQLDCGELSIEFTSQTEFRGMRYCGIGGYYSGTYVVRGDRAILTDGGYSTNYRIEGNTLVYDEGNGSLKIYVKR